MKTKIEEEKTKEKIHSCDLSGWRMRPNEFTKHSLRIICLELNAEMGKYLLFRGIFSISFHTFMFIHRRFHLFECLPILRLGEE